MKTKTCLTSLLPASKSGCTGCGLCLTVCKKNAISLKENEDGFVSAVIDASKCLRCGACHRICKQLSEVPSGSNHQCYESWHKNSVARRSSSSGGVMYALAEHCIQRGGIVFGVEMQGSSRPCFVGIESLDDLPRIQGSKYLQANVGNCLSELKKAVLSGRQVVFSGLACHARAVRAMFGGVYDNLLIVDIACFGAPSIHLLHAFLREYDLVPQEVQKMHFRYKTKGWRDYVLMIQTSDRTIQAPRNNLFMQGMLCSLGLNQCCYTCRTGIEERPGDLTLGDFWGRPTQEDELDGVSLVVSHTARGEQALQKLSETLHLKLTSRELVEKCNAGVISRHSPIPPLRKAFLGALKKHSVSYVLQRFIRNGLTPNTGILLGSHFFPTPTIFRKIKGKIKAIFGRMRNRLYPKHITWEE